MSQQVPCFFMDAKIEALSVKCRGSTQKGVKVEVGGRVGIVVFQLGEHRDHDSSNIAAWFYFHIL